MTPWTMYWITRLDSLLLVLAFTAMGGLVILGICAANMAYCNENSKSFARLGIGMLIGLFLFIFCMASLFFVPSERDMYKILIVPKIVNNEVIKSDCKELYDLAVSALKEELTKKAE